MAELVLRLKYTTDVLRKKCAGVLAGFVESSGLGKPRPYYPEAHYMRGPGPKWIAKYGSANARLVKIQARAHSPARR